MKNRYKMLNLNILPRVKSQKGITLLECLFYVASLAIILNLGTLYLFQIQRGHKRQQEFLHQTVKTVLAGRKMKQDIENGQVITAYYKDFSFCQGHLIIRSPHQVIVYQLNEGALQRLFITNDKPKGTRVILKEVESFNFKKDNEGEASFITLNLRLKKNHRKGRLEPLFSFKAIPGVYYGENN